MENNIMVGWSFQLCEWIMKVTLLNGLWIFFSLLGGGIFGIFPATVALLTCLKQEEERSSIIKLFVHTYRKEFIHSNKLGLMFWSVGFVLCIDLLYTSQFDGLFLNIVTIMLISVGIVYFYVFINSLIIYVNHRMSVRAILKRALYLSALHPIRGILTLMVLVILAGVSIYYPIIALFLSFGLGGLMIVKIGRHAMLKV